MGTGTRPAVVLGAGLSIAAAIIAWWMAAPPPVQLTTAPATIGDVAREVFEAKTVLKSILDGAGI